MDNSKKNHLSSKHDFSSPDPFSEVQTVDNSNTDGHLITLSVNKFNISYQIGSV
jgi:hypothetical protein